MFGGYRTWHKMSRIYQFLRDFKGKGWRRVTPNSNTSNAHDGHEWLLARLCTPMPANRHLKNLKNRRPGTFPIWRRSWDHPLSRHPCFCPFQQGQSRQVFPSELLTHWHVGHPLCPRKWHGWVCCHSQFWSEEVVALHFKQRVLQVQKD